MSPAIHAFILSTASNRKRVSSGSTAKMADAPTEWAMGSVCSVYRSNMSHLGGEEALDGKTTNRRVEHLGGVREADPATDATHRRGHLHEASGVGGHEELSVGGEHRT